jgi:hypothetical protein
VEQVVISQIRKRVPRLPVMRLSESTLSPAPRGRTMFASVSVVRAHQLQGIAFLHMTVINAQDYDSSFNRFVGGRRGFCNGVSFGVDRQELLTNAADILFGEFAAEWTRMNGQLATKSVHRSNCGFCQVRHAGTAP